MYHLQGVTKYLHFFAIHPVCRILLRKILEQHHGIRRQSGIRSYPYKSPMVKNLLSLALSYSVVPNVVSSTHSHSASIKKSSPSIVVTSIQPAKPPSSRTSNQVTLHLQGGPKETLPNFRPLSIPDQQAEAEAQDRLREPPSLTEDTECEALKGH